MLTDGSKGTWDPDADTAALVAAREDEQRGRGRGARARPARSCSSAQVDGELEVDARRCASGSPCRIRVLRPDVVLGHDPWKRYRLHPDHRHAGWLTVDGVVAARDPHFFPEHGLPATGPTALLLFEADEPDHVEDVTGFADTKIAALLEHRSQFHSTMDIEPDDDGTPAHGVS